MTPLFKYSFFKSISYITVVALGVLFTNHATAQTLRFKCNSEKHLKVVFKGVGKDGKEVTKTFDDVSLGFWKNISLQKAKYGYDLYHNKEMVKDGVDASGRWKTVTVTDLNTNAQDTYDIAKGEEGKRLGNTHIWLKVKTNIERDYQVTSVFFYDHAK